MKNDLEITFYDLFDEWLNYKRTKVKESTYFNYSFVINESFKKYFQNVSLEEVKNLDFYSIIDELKQKVSRKTLRDRISILKSVLRYGERKYDMDFKIDLITMPTIYNKEGEVCALRWKNIDFEKKLIEVEKNSSKSLYGRKRF